jgi:putative ATP-binding cassette transporter
MELIYFIARYSRRAAILAILTGILSGVSNTGLLVVINSTLAGGSLPVTMQVLCFVGLCLVLPLTRFLAEALLTKLGQGALYNLRLQLSKRILGAPLRRLEEMGAHRILATLTDDLPAITNGLLLIPVLSINAAVIIGGLVYLGLMSWKVLLIVLGFMVVGIISYQLPIIKSLQYLKAARESEDDLLKCYGALTQGTKELKLHRNRREAFISDVLQSTVTSLRNHNVKGMLIYSAAASWGQILVFVVIGLILFALPGMTVMSQAALTGYVLTLLYIMTPLQVIMNTMPNIGRASVAVKNVEQLGFSLKSLEGDEDSSSHPESTNPWPLVELVNVTHKYKREGEENSFTLGPINLTLYPGEIIFLIGGNGSGKTSLAKLLTGLYTPESGEIRLNGRVVTDETRDGYRQNFSAVFSDFYLFERLLGLSHLELDEQARTYLSQLQLDHKVKVINGALSTTDLSQGQRKRLALLSAYLEDRPIYLFDEWAADQDPLFRDIFYYKILPQLKKQGKIVVVISHDDRYFAVGDRIIKLDYGKLEYDSPVTHHMHKYAEGVN